MTVPPIALQRFEEHKDNPMVQALTRFIMFNLKRELTSVTSWGVEVSEKSERTFYLHFRDGTKCSGRLREIWQVQVFEYGEEKQEKDTHTVPEAVAEGTKECDDKEAFGEH